MKRASFCLASLFLSVSLAGAVGVTITNPGFEDDLGAAQAGGGWTDAVPTGWADPQGGDNTNFMEVIGGFASEGQVHLGFDGNELGMVYQDLGTAWAPNTTYTLTVGVGNRAGFGAGVGRFFLTSSFDALPAAGPVGGPYSLYTPSVFSADLDTFTIVPADNTFGDAVFTYTTGPVAPVGNLRIGVQQTSATRVHVDNWRLDATVIPEPSTAAVLALAAGLVLRRRRA